MEEIFSKLNEIEVAAQKILEDAEQKRLKISLDAENQMTEYDRKLTEKTDKRISDIRSQLEEDKEARLSILKEEASKTLAEMDAYYSANHSRLSRELYEKIIR